MIIHGIFLCNHSHPKKTIHGNLKSTKIQDPIQREAPYDDINLIMHQVVDCLVLRQKCKENERKYKEVHQRTVLVVQFIHEKKEELRM